MDSGRTKKREDGRKRQSYRQTQRKKKRLTKPYRKRGGHVIVVGYAGTVIHCDIIAL